MEGSGRVNTSLSTAAITRRTFVDICIIKHSNLVTFVFVVLLFGFVHAHVQQIFHNHILFITSNMFFYNMTCFLKRYMTYLTFVYNIMTKERRKQNEDQQ